MDKNLLLPEKKIKRQKEKRHEICSGEKRNAF